MAIETKVTITVYVPDPDADSAIKWLTCVLDGADFGYDVDAVETYDTNEGAQELPANYGAGGSGPSVAAAWDAHRRAHG